MASRSQLKRQAEAARDAFNAAHPVGSPVRCDMADEPGYCGHVTAPAYLVGHCVFVDVVGFPWAHPISEVSAIPTQASTHTNSTESEVV